jgi:hypothetical protein
MPHRNDASTALSRVVSRDTMVFSLSAGALVGGLTQVIGLESGQNNLESMIQAVGDPGPGPTWQVPPFGVRWTVNSPSTPYTRDSSCPVRHLATESRIANQARQSARVES